jgi:hypothetical protein
MVARQVKAGVCHQYGSAAVEEVDRPTLPNGAVLVRVREGRDHGFLTRGEGPRIAHHGALQAKLAASAVLPVPLYFATCG